MRFDDVERIGSLLQKWDVTALYCLKHRSLRYTDLGSQMSEWSGQRISDSTVTQTVKRLSRTGLVCLVEDRVGTRTVSRYALTEAGRERLEAAEAAVRDRGDRSGGGTPEQPAAQHHTTKSQWWLEDPRTATAGNGADVPSRTGSGSSAVSPSIDTTRAHPARRYNFWLGGKDHFEADRRSAAEIQRLMPSIAVAAKENRRFLRRVVRFLAAEAGIRQFLDIGTGLPAPDNTHDVAQGVNPRARIVYVDNDPLVLANARALLTGTPEGRTEYLDADLRTPEKIIQHPDLRATIDLGQPVALLLIAVLHFIVDDENPYSLVARLVRHLAPGSYVAITHATQDYMPAEQIALIKAAETGGRQGQFRSRAELSRFFDGLHLVPPGICSVAEWRPDDRRASPPSPADVACLGGVARIP